MARVIERWGADPAALRTERVCCADGVEIEYVQTPLQSGGNNIMGRNELAGDATRMALVWQGEMYGAKIGNDWRHVAAGYGVPYVHRELSIFIHLPDKHPVRDGAYRQRLVRTDTGEELECEDFMREVRTHMPKWVRELVERARAEAGDQHGGGRESAGGTASPRSHSKGGACHCRFSSWEWQQFPRRF